MISNIYSCCFTTNIINLFDEINFVRSKTMLDNRYLIFHIIEFQNTVFLGISVLQETFLLMKVL